MFCGFKFVLFIIVDIILIQITAAMKKEPLKVMISGAPASGKGTQCEFIKKKVGINYNHIVGNTFVLVG